MMDNPQNSQNHNGMTCKCPHHKMGPLAVVIFGLVFLLGALNVLSAQVVGIVWPIIVILAGLFKMKEGSCKCCNK